MRNARRRFLSYVGWMAAAISARSAFAAAAVPRPLAAWLGDPRFGAFVRSCMASKHIPGLSLAVIDDGQLVYTGGFGWANLQKHRPMNAYTLINIASVTKTITCTAVMQLWERGKFELDDDVSKYLPFGLRNPAYPDRAVTIRQLLVHTSSIADGPHYSTSYVCGDSPTALESWLRAELTIDGGDDSARRNFHPWPPGTRAAYSNIGYGVLGLLVQRLSGVSYADYVAKHIFEPVRMTESRFFLKGLDFDKHAVPYNYVEGTDFSKIPLRDPAWIAPADGEGTQVPHCLYSFVTLSDGLVRTSARELARFLLVYVSGGLLDNERILRSETVAQILSDQKVNDPGAGDRRQGLTWSEFPGEIWGHTGGDPGVSTSMMFRPRDRRGVVVLTNSDDGESVVQEVTELIFSRTN
jgi:CubicO group peptidase (beta-lactamase class C family)